MSRISEKVAYLDGLMEGLEIEDAKQKKQIGRASCRERV